MLVAVIDANGGGTIIQILGLPDAFEDDDLARALLGQGFDKKCLMLDDIPPSTQIMIGTYFLTYAWVPETEALLSVDPPNINVEYDVKSSLGNGDGGAHILIRPEPGEHIDLAFERIIGLSRSAILQYGIAEADAS